jgi:hypothetical protein
MLDSAGRLQNTFAGMPFEKIGYMGLSKVVRRVSMTGGNCFAIKASDFGSPAERHDQPETAAAKLSLKLAQDGRPALFTPYAVLTTAATYSQEILPDLAPLEELIKESVVDLPRLNPNLSLFDIQDVHQRGIF